MLNKIINLINYFRVARFSLYRELKFFYEPPPKKVSEIQNYEFKSKIVSEILKFINHEQSKTIQIELV